MRSFLLLIAIVLIHTGTVPAAAEDDSSIQQTFTVSGSRYIFNSSFTIAGAAESCLLDMLYQADQLRQYARHLDAVEMIDSGQNWQLIAYHYTGFFYHARSIFKRQIDRRAGRIDYTLQKIEQSGLLSADIKHISGHYSISNAGDGSLLITFHQQGSIGESFLSNFYFDSIKSTAMEYIGNMRAYASVHCR